MTGSRRKLPVTAAIGLLLAPATALAHLVNTGMGPVYDGIGHLVMTPEDLIPTLAIALYCGLRGRHAGRQVIFVLPLLWFVGGLFGLTLESAPAFPVTSLSFLVLGLLIAADARLPLQAVTPLVGAIGLVHGILNGLALKSGPGGLALLGISGALFVFIALVSAFVVSLEKPWSRIVVRVMGSWVAASGLLMIGWFFRGQV
jgi:hydrogenase/urease accessory protein HupE